MMESQKNKSQKDRLNISDQENKLVELQHALIEEAKFLERLSAYKPEEKQCCTAYTGQRDSLCGPCVKLHAPCTVDEDCYTIESGDQKYTCALL